MRLNRYIATYSHLSRRKADTLIEEGAVIVNRKTAHTGMNVTEKDIIFVNGQKLIPVKRKTTTVLLNKPTGYVCSKDGQGSPTVYDLLQSRMQNLNIAGRLDKDSSGLVILTDDGSLLQELTHPKFNKKKIYKVALDRPLRTADLERVRTGVNIGDTRMSKFHIDSCDEGDHTNCYRVTISEGRNRQIRRTFEALKYSVERLHRIQMGEYQLGNLSPEEFREVEHIN